MKRISFFLILLSVIFHGSSAYGQWDWKPDGASMGIALENDGKKNVLNYRTSLLWDIDYLMVEFNGWNISSYLDTSVSYWKSRVSEQDRAGISSHSSMFAFAASPIFRISPNQQYHGISPYIEGGIGIGFTSHASLHGEKSSRIDMGSAFTFENRIAVGVMIGQNWDLSLRWYHYSNGSFNRNNEDLDFFGVSLSYWF